AKVLVPATSASAARPVPNRCFRFVTLKDMLLPGAITVPSGLSIRHLWRCEAAEDHGQDAAVADVLGFDGGVDADDDGEAQLLAAAGMASGHLEDLAW